MIVSHDLTILSMIMNASIVVKAVMLALVLASLFYPLQTRLVRLCRGSRNLASLTIIVIITFVLVIPIFLFASALIAQAPNPAARTQVVLLGTGTPNAEPDRSGPAATLPAPAQASLVTAPPAAAGKKAPRVRIKTVVKEVEPPPADAPKPKDPFADPL